MKKIITKEERVLEMLGLGENEAKLYLLMLKHPKSTVQELQQKSPFPRTMLYYILNDLMQKNLVTQVKQKWRSVYVAEDPERLYDLLEERQQEFKTKKFEVLSAIPELSRTFRLSSNRPGSRIFEGLDEYRIALDDVFTTKADVIYTYVSSGGNKKPGIEVREDFHKRRRDKNTVVKFLVPDKETYENLNKFHKNDKLCEIRIISKETPVQDVDMKLYDGKLLYTRYNEKEPICFMIEDRPFYKMQKMLFNILWEEAK